MNVLSTVFGELLRMYRKRERLTQEKLANQLRTYRQHVGGWENNKNDVPPPSREQVLEIQSILNLSEVETDSLLWALGLPMQVCVSFPDLKNRISEVSDENERKYLPTEEIVLRGTQVNQTTTTNSHCLEPPEGAVHPHSPCYIERPVDQQVLTAIKKTGVTLTIEGPSFVGKSSLLMRLASVAQNELNKKVVILRLGDILGTSQMENNVSFYRRFCYSLSSKLNIRENTAFYWDVPLTDPERCTAYISDYILPRIDASIQSLVIALEGMELLFETEVCDQFSRMLRGWTDERAFSGASIWRKVDLVLVTSTEPYLFIENFHGSPFNVGLRHHLSDFEREHLLELNERHISPLEEGKIDDLMNCIGGHPYLVRQTFYWLSKGATLEQILKIAKNDHNGPFDSHLRGLMKKVKRGFDQNIETELCKAIDNQLSDELMFQRLRGAGLIKREDGRIKPRCKLYKEYFKERLKCNG